MPPTLPHGSQITIVHRTKSGTDARGNDVFSETQEAISSCAFAPGAGGEEWAGTEEVSDMVTVWFPDGTTITALDAFILPNGDKYEVQGPANQSQSPWTGIVSFVQVQGRFVTGASV